VLFEIGSKEAASKIYEGLKAEGLLVRYWGGRPDLCTKLRVTVGARPSNERFVELVSRIVGGEAASVDVSDFTRSWGGKAAGGAASPHSRPNSGRRHYKQAASENFLSWPGC